MRRLPVALAVAGALGAAVPATALAAKSYSGKTSQGRAVAVKIADDEAPQQVRVNWITRRCATSGSRFQHITTFRRPFDVGTPDAIDEVRRFTVRDPGGYRSAVTLMLEGAHDDAPLDRWSGRLEGRVVVSRRGKVVDRCRLKPITWSARLKP